MSKDDEDCVRGLMDKKKKVKELEELARQTGGLYSEKALSEKHTRWRLNCLVCLDEIFGRNSRFYQEFARIPWRNVQSTVLEGREVLNIRQVQARMNHEAYQDQLGSAKGLLLSAIDTISRTSDIGSLYEGTDNQSSELIKVVNLIEHKLRASIRGTPSCEKEIQDGFENLLLGAGIDYSREQERHAYSTKSYIPDFACRSLELSIEIKFCMKDSAEARIVDEINADIQGYSKDYKNQFFVVYDIGVIRDIDRFTSDLSGQNVSVFVVKH